MGSFIEYTIKEQNKKNMHVLLLHKRKHTVKGEPFFGRKSRGSSRSLGSRNTRVYEKGEKN